MKRSISLKMFDRAIPVDQSSINVKDRTVEMVWTTGARVLRYDQNGDAFYEELDVSETAIDLTRLNAGAPVLNSHNAYDLSDQLGVVDKAWIVPGEGRALTRFSRRPDVEPFFQDIADKIIRNVSCGYKILRAAYMGDAEDGIPIFRALLWCPWEISMVSMGADAGAGTRKIEDLAYECEILNSTENENNGGTMKTEQTAQPANQEQPNLDAVRKEGADVGAAAATSRASEILMSVRAAKLDVSVAEEFINSKLTVDEVRKAIIEKWAAANPQPEIRNQTSATVGDEGKAASMRAAAANAILHRYDPSKTKLSEDGRNFRGLSMIELAKEFIHANGGNTRGIDRMEIAKRALQSTSDFSSILADVSNKTLRQGYDSGMQSFRPIVKVGSAPDFKNINRTQMGDAPSLEKVNETGEIKRGSITDGKEVYSLSTYAKIVAISRKALVNDDMSAFTRIPQDMGKAVSDLESDLVWAIFTSNPNMGDAVALFHATHGNLGSAAALAVATATAARAAMRGQKNLQLRPINLTPKFVIVSPADEVAAEQLVGPVVPNIATSVNPFSQKLGIIVEPRLTKASGTQSYFFAADPSQIDMIEISYLEGQEGAYIETKQGFDVDGMEMKVRHDFAAKALDWRGLFKNAGV